MSIFAGHTRLVSAKRSVPMQQRDSIVNARALPSSHQPRHPAMDSLSAPSYQSTFETTRQLPQQAMSVAAVNDWLSPVEDRHQKEVRYPYVPSERTHHVELPASYGWSSQSHHPATPSELSLPPLRHYQHANPPGGHDAIPRQLGHLHYYESQLQELPPSPPDSQPPLQRYPHHVSSSLHYGLRQGHSQSSQDFASAPTFNPGLASHDPQLDDKWGSFMQDPGLLEDQVNFKRN